MRIVLNIADTDMVIYENISIAQDMQQNRTIAKTYHFYRWKTL